MSGASSWLQKMRKGELVELADSVGYKEYETCADVEFFSRLANLLAGMMGRRRPISRSVSMNTLQTTQRCSPAKRDLPRSTRDAVMAPQSRRK